MCYRGVIIGILTGPAFRASKGAMAWTRKSPAGPDLTKGVPLDSIADGGIAARPCRRRGGAAGAARRGGVRGRRRTARITTGRSPKALVVGDTVRCPWHHACFSLRTGEALRAPALNPLACWRVERAGRHGSSCGRRSSSRAAAARQGRRRAEPDRHRRRRRGRLRARPRCCGAQGYRRPHRHAERDDAPPVDGPNLSKDYLAGSAPEEWMPLRAGRLLRGAATSSCGWSPTSRRSMPKRSACHARRRQHASPTTRCCSPPAPSRCGCRPRRGPAARAHAAHAGRQPRDHRQAPTRAKRAVVIGASFIGLEVAASLRARGLEVHVVAPEKRPLERVLGPQIGRLRARAARGARRRSSISSDTVERDRPRSRSTLKSGETLDADLVVVGVGVRPRSRWPSRPASRIDRGVTVDEYLRDERARTSSRPATSRAGPIRISASASASSTGWSPSARARPRRCNMLGACERFDAVPFFWSQHYDVPINYVGHAEKWDEIDIEGDIADKDCVAALPTQRQGAGGGVDLPRRESLEAEIAMEREAA